MNFNDSPITVHLLIRGESPAVPITLRTESKVFGRYDPEALKQPEIDLTPYNAHEEGVSRLHAELIIVDNRVCLQDLNSRNGTYVNNEKIAPYIEHPIYDGDWIKLGRLRILVNFLD